MTPVAQSGIHGFLHWIRSRFHPLWKLRRTRWFRVLQRRFDFITYARLNKTSYRMAVHCLRDMPWLLGRTVAEAEVQSTLSELNKILEPKVFWDIGANLGYYSWILLAENDVLSVRLFEPDPANQRLINKTIQRNRLTQATLDAKALSDRVGETIFILDEQSGATGQFAHLYETANDTSIAKSYDLSKTTMVETTTLDATLAEGAQPPELMKIDVEEAEGLVLSGGTQLIENHRPVIVMESFGEEPLKNLASHNYQSYALDNNRNFLCLPKPVDKCLSTMISQLERWHSR